MLSPISPRLTPFSAELRPAVPTPAPTPAPKPALKDGPVEYKDRPNNQPDNRFRNQKPVPDLPPDPLPNWLEAPLKKVGIIMEPDASLPWKAKAVFNPTTIVKDGKVYMLYRAQDVTGPGQWNGTSSVGLAVSDDGINFRPAFSPDRPVMSPTEPYELPGGCEDPRVVQLENGKYVMTYTAFDGKMARLAIAVSDDLINWEKKGLAFTDEQVLANPVVENSPWTKSGAIVPEKINGKYIMYFGESRIFIATSDDGIHWHHDPKSKPVLTTRPGRFDQGLVEPGPTPWVDAEGIHMIYNGDAPPHGYQVGEVVFDKNDPSRIVRRSESPFLKPDQPYELVGQVGNVIFAEGYVRFRGRSIVYYGAADGKIAAAAAPAPATSVLSLRSARAAEGY